MSQRVVLLLKQKKNIYSRDLLDNFCLIRMNVSNQQLAVIVT